MVDDDNGDIVAVVDAGGWKLRWGRAGFDLPEGDQLNGFARHRKEGGRVYWMEEMEQVADASMLQIQRPFERGLPTRWDWQLQLLSRALKSGTCAEARHLVMTLPSLTPSVLKQSMCEAVFEELGIRSLVAESSACWIGRQLAQGSTALVVDCGYSGTTVTPVIQGSVYAKGIRRMDVGGKILTNALKELVSYRSWNMMDEMLLMNRVKEQLLYVSPSFLAEMRTARAKPATLEARYLLPDGLSADRGRALQPGDETPPNAQVLTLGNERIAVPEAMFHPKDIGLDQAGLPECIQLSVEACPVEARADLIRSILPVGGTFYMPGLSSRLYQEVRALMDDSLPVHLMDIKNPDQLAWSSASKWTEQYRRPMERGAVTIETYNEWGSLKTSSLIGNQ